MLQDILIDLGALLAFAAVASCTGAGRPQILAALAGGVAAALLSVVWDYVAAQAGVWEFVTPSGGLAPDGSLALYVFVLLVYGGVLELLGWRVFQSRGARGLAAMLPAVVLLGPLFDRIAARITGTVVYEAGLVSWIVDGLYFAAIFVVGLGVMRLVLGARFGQAPAGALPSAP